jgi:hypothetical protein
MKRIQVLSLALAAALPACGTPKTAPTDDFSALDGADPKSDVFSTHWKLIGSLDYGQTSSRVTHTGTPTYRAFKFAGQVGDVVDIWVRSDDGDAVAWLLNDNFKTLASNDDADETTLDSHLHFKLTANRSAEDHTYYVAFREYSHDRAHFTVELQGPACSYGGKSYSVGDGFPSTDGCNTCSCTARGVICTLRACPAPDYYSCQRDGDCTAIPKAGCCHNGYLEAVNKNQVDAYNKANACTTPGVFCAQFLIVDNHVARCDFTTNKCQLVDPQGARCGGFIADAPTCPSGYQCDFRGHVPDVGGVCEKTCGGIAAFPCADGLTCHLDTTCTSGGGADCGGLCY